MGRNCVLDVLITKQSTYSYLELKTLTLEFICNPVRLKRAGRSQNLYSRGAQRKPGGPRLYQGGRAPLASRWLRPCALFICGRDIELIYRSIAQSALSISLQYTYLHLKVNHLIEFFIVKLEQIFVFGDNY